MKLELRYYGDPVLRKPCESVDVFDESLRQFTRDMFETMYAEKGIGLAAQQVGRTIDLCVIDIPSEADTDEEGLPLNPDVRMPLVLINARILEHGEEESPYEEGCLSFPEMHAMITRPESVRISYQDEEGSTHTLSAQGLLARAIQHEMDHLQGVLFIDHMTQVRKIALNGRLKRLKKETQSKLKARRT